MGCGRQARLVRHARGDRFRRAGVRLRGPRLPGAVGRSRRRPRLADHRGPAPLRLRDVAAHGDVLARRPVHGARRDGCCGGVRLRDPRPGEPRAHGVARLPVPQRGGPDGRRGGHGRVPAHAGSLPGRRPGAAVATRRAELGVDVRAGGTPHAPDHAPGRAAVVPGHDGVDREPRGRAGPRVGGAARRPLGRQSLVLRGAGRARAAEPGLHGPRARPGRACGSWRGP